MVREPSQIDRRSVLKATGAAASATAVGTGTVAASPSDSMGTRLFGELSFGHEGDVGQAAMHDDGFASYLTTDRGTVHLTRFLGDEAFETFERNDAVVAGTANVVTPPGAYVSGGPTDLIPLDGVRDVKAERPFTLPAVRVTRAGDALTVAVADERATAEPGESVTVTLDPRPAVVPAMAATTTETTDPRTGTQSETRGLGTPKQVQLRPFATLENHGEVELFDNRTTDDDATGVTN